MTLEHLFEKVPCHVVATSTVHAHFIASVADAIVYWLLYLERDRLFERDMLIGTRSTVLRSFHPDVKC